MTIVPASTRAVNDALRGILGDLTKARSIVDEALWIPGERWAWAAPTTPETFNAVLDHTRHAASSLGELVASSAAAGDATTAAILGPQMTRVGEVVRTLSSRADDASPEFLHSDVTTLIHAEDTFQRSAFDVIDAISEIRTA